MARIDTKISGHKDQYLMYKPINFGLGPSPTGITASAFILFPYIIPKNNVT